MASSRQFKTEITFGGKVDNTFSSAIANVKRGLAGIHAAANNATRSIGSGFLKLDQGLSRAALSVAKFAAAGVGLIAGYLGFESVSGFISQSTEEFEKARLSAAKLSAALANNKVLAGRDRRRSKLKAPRYLSRPSTCPR